jgi:hypothetical protein
VNDPARNTYPVAFGTASQQKEIVRVRVTRLSGGRSKVGTPILGAPTTNVPAEENRLQPCGVCAETAHTKDCLPAGFRKIYGGDETVTVVILPSEAPSIRTR